MMSHRFLLIQGHFSRIGIRIRKEKKRKERKKKEKRKEKKKGISWKEVPRKKKEEM